MKKIICLMLGLVMAALLVSCAANPRCEYETAIEALAVSEEPTAYIAEDDEEYTVDGKALAEMISGKWEKSGKPDDFDKIVAVTVDTQYEVCFFEGDGAIVYCGYAGVFQRDRQYYKCELDSELGDICEYIRENGEVLEREED